MKVAIIDQDDFLFDCPSAVIEPDRLLIIDDSLKYDVSHVDVLDTIFLTKEDNGNILFSGEESTIYYSEVYDSHAFASLSLLSLKSLYLVESLGVAISEVPSLQDLYKIVGVKLEDSNLVIDESTAVGSAVKTIQSNVAEVKETVDSLSADLSELASNVGVFESQFRQLFADWYLNDGVIEKLDRSFDQSVIDKLETAAGDLDQIQLAIQSVGLDTTAIKNALPSLATSFQMSTLITKIDNLSDQASGLFQKVSSSYLEWVQIASETANEEVQLNNAYGSLSSLVTRLELASSTISSARDSIIEFSSTTSAIAALTTSLSENLSQIESAKSLYNSVRESLDSFTENLLSSYESTIQSVSTALVDLKTQYESVASDMEAVKKQSVVTTVATAVPLAVSAYADLRASERPRVAL